jgi:nucleoside diphosphate kinase/adenylate kinase family enzyme
MLALDEKVRTVVLLKSELNDARGEEIFSKFQACYLDVKAQKQVFMTGPDSDAFFHYLPKSARQMGLMEVLVLENLDGNVVDETMKLIEALEADPEFPKGLYCSQGAWEAARDLEYFFPHLDSLPTERTLALIKPDGIRAGAIANQTLEQMVEAKVADAGLLIVGKGKLMLQVDQAQALCADYKGTPDFDGAMGVLKGEPGCIAMCLEGPGAVGKWNNLCGPRNSEIARRRAPTTLRAMWGTDGTSNALHASANMEAADKELSMFFPEGTLSIQRTLCIVKPDAMSCLLQIRQAIETKGFTVLAEKQTVMAEDRAREFYRDLADQPFFDALVNHACSGPCCILVLCRLEAVSVWQQMMGPEVVSDAQQTRPTSLRALYGSDGQRNALHGSDSTKSAAREVRFFFPELGADPIPSNDEVRDYLFRKSSTASMDLKNLSDVDLNMNNIDSTLQQLLSKGLMSLCQVQPKGLGAVKWLSRWLMENNPNKAKADGFEFQPSDRTQRFVEHGTNQDGLVFAVEAPPAAKKKQVIDVDISGEVEQHRATDLTTPPFVVFLLGGPGVGKGTQCSKLRETFNLVHLSTGDLMRQEVAAKTYLGTEIYKCMQQGTLVPDTVTLQLLKKTMVKHQDTNRFILDGFPRSIEQAKRFEQEIAELAFGVYFESSKDLMKRRVAGRAANAPGRVDDDPDTVDKRIKIFDEQTVPTVEYYTPIGKIRRIDTEKDAEEDGAARI